MRAEFQEVEGKEFWSGNMARHAVTVASTGIPCILAHSQQDRSLSGCIGYGSNKDENGCKQKAVLAYSRKTLSTWVLRWLKLLAVSGANVWYCGMCGVGGGRLLSATDGRSSSYKL